MKENLNDSEAMDIGSIRQMAFQAGFKKGFDEGYEKGYAEAIEEIKQHDTLLHYDEEFTMEGFRKDGFIESYVEEKLKALSDTSETDTGSSTNEMFSIEELEKITSALEKEADAVYSVMRATELLEKGDHSLSRIAQLSGLPLSKVQELAAQNPV